METSLYDDNNAAVTENTAAPSAIEAFQSPPPPLALRRQRHRRGCDPLVATSASARILRMRSPPTLAQYADIASTEAQCGDDVNSLDHAAAAPDQHSVIAPKRKSSKQRKLQLTIRRRRNRVHDQSGSECGVTFDAPDSNSVNQKPHPGLIEIGLPDTDNFAASRANNGSALRSAIRGRNKQQQRAAGLPLLVHEEDDGDARRLRKRDAEHAVCKVCGRRFRSFYLATHMRTHTGVKPFQCSESSCGRQFSTECYLKMHVRSSHRDPHAFRCELCQRNLASRGSLREHMRTHSDERPFQCHVCYKIFRQPALLINHVKTHSSEQPYQCDQCGNRYKYKRSMEMHKERIHDGVRHSYPCQICGNIFTRKTKLKDHTNWHLGQSPHQCDTCGRRFLSRKTLITHFMIHAELKPYTCLVCNKSFRQAHVLKRHNSTHTGVKPFRCDVCQKQFIHRVYLMRHTCCPRVPLSSTTGTLDPLTSFGATKEATLADETADVMAAVMLHLPSGV